MSVQGVAGLTIHVSYNAFQATELLVLTSAARKAYGKARRSASLNGYLVLGQLAAVLADLEFRLGLFHARGVIQMNA